MNNHVNAIANRLSLRHPQRDSLQILDCICELLPIQNIQDLETSLATLKAKCPSALPSPQYAAAKAQNDAEEFMRSFS